MTNYSQPKFVLKLLIGMALLCLFILPVGAKEPYHDNDWLFGAEIYLWGSAIGGKSSTGNDIDFSFNDIISNLNMALMGTIVAHKNKWSYLADIIYMDVSDDEKGSFTLPVGSGFTVGTELDVDIKSWVVQPMVGYRVYDNQKGSIDLTAGARYIWMETELKLETTSPLGGRKIKSSESGDNWDGIVGVRGLLNLTEKWYASGYLDVGTGQSDYTWQAKAAVAYKFNKVDAVLGYRYLKWKFDNNDVFYNLKLDGPFAGVRFSF